MGQPKAWWPGAGSNRRHCDFQSHALPTELPGHPRPKWNRARRRVGKGKFFGIAIRLAQDATPRPEQRRPGEPGTHHAPSSGTGFQADSSGMSSRTPAGRRRFPGISAATSPPEATLLARVGVRLIEPHQPEEFNRRLTKDHHPHQPHVAGPTLRDVALIDGQPVASTWSSTTPASSPSRTARGSPTSPPATSTASTASPGSSSRALPDTRRGPARVAGQGRRAPPAQRPPSAARRSPATCAGGWRSSAGGCRSRSPRPSPAWPWTARPRAAAGGATALYTDGLSLFGHKSTAEGRDPKSEFQRALTALGVSHLVAPNPQAKGRIERRFSPCRPAS